MLLRGKRKRRNVGARSPHGNLDARISYNGSISTYLLCSPGNVLKSNTLVLATLRLLRNTEYAVAFCLLCLAYSTCQSSKIEKHSVVYTRGSQPEIRQQFHSKRPLISCLSHRFLAQTLQPSSPCPSCSRRVPRACVLLSSALTVGRGCRWCIPQL